MVNLGYGMDFALIPAQNLTKMGLILNIASSLVILANLWSKTSFALTLLRLPLRWMKYTLWFIIISMTVFLGTSSVFIWAQCFSPGQTTIPSTELRCLPDNVMLGYSTFSGGEFPTLVDTELPCAVLTARFSIFRDHGPNTRASSLEVPLETSNENGRENWGYVCHEHGDIVGNHTQFGIQLKLTLPSAGCAAIMKTTLFPGVKVDISM